MEEIKYTYFLNDKEVDRDNINWKRPTTVKIVGNNIYVTYIVEEAQKEDGSFPVSIEEYLAFFGLKVKPAEEAEVNTGTPIEYDNSGGTNMGILNPSEKLHVYAPTGVKYNKAKAPLDIVQTRQFAKALQLVALATAFGNKKYEATDKDYLNFKRVSGGSQTYLDAAARHNTEREEIDEDTGLNHIIHVVWNNLAALELWAEENNINVKKYSESYLEELSKKY